MDTIIPLAVYPFFISAFLSYVITKITIRLMWKYKILDDPKTHKHAKVIHKKPVPRGGGLAIYLTILIVTSIFLPFDKHVRGILAGITVLVIMGLYDDYLLSRNRDFSPYIRLIIQFIAAAMPIIAGIGIAFWLAPNGQIIDLSSPKIAFSFMGETREIWILSDLFALFWIVLVMNFLNWGAKGVDGQLSGVIVIAAGVIGLLSLRFSADIAEWPVIVLAMILSGSYLGFLPWHIYPQKIMPSFSGSNIAGFMLAVLSILTTAKVGALALVLGVPLIDSGYTLVRRLATGKSPVWGDRGHLHHRLLDAGLNIRQIAYFYWIFTATLGIAALRLNATSKLYTIIGITMLVGGLLIWLKNNKL